MNILHHLWQSTLFAAAAWALALFLRGHRARLRYWIWLAASYKFLVPLSILVGLGKEVAMRRETPIVPHKVSAPIARMLVPLEPPLRPFRQPPQEVIWRWLLPILWSGGTGVVLWRWARSSRRCAGPGVSGIFRQRFILPEAIQQWLTADELAAIVAHERYHMRCRDNLTAAIHMLVEAVFWFHPLVWWIEKRLIEERERACDEEVLRAGSAPAVYASGILKVCEICLTAPLACVSSATGADLKRRIEAIVNWRGIPHLDIARRAVLAVAAVAAAAVPIVIGADRLAFEVASVKRYHEGPRGEVERKITPGPDGLTVRRQSLREIVGWGYGGDPAVEIAGPAWIDGEDYDVFAKAGRAVPVDQLRQMLQTLLAERFKLALHRETKKQGVYALVVGSRGSKLNPVHQESTRRMFMQFNDGVAGFDIVANMQRFAEVVSMFTDRKVIDETGLPGVYSIALRVPMDANPFEHMTPGVVFRGFGPASGIFSALEPFGLKLESQKAPVDFLMIDHIERPSDN
jgi:uncharacterized protein (TIGR03435 family)